MRLWHEALISQLPSSSTLGATSRVLAPCVAMAGAESMKRWTMSLPTSPYRLYAYHDFDHEGDG